MKRRIMSLALALGLCLGMLPTAWADAPYTVTITGGANATLTGTTVQSELSGAMTDVTYTANDGYYFPTDYADLSDGSTNGIQVTRTSATVITVSGTPTADVTIDLDAPTAKAKPAAPTGLGKTDETATGNDGTITGVTSAMEYKKGSGAWVAITGTTVENLAPATYHVRVKATDTALASDAADVTIAAYVAPAALAFADNSSYDIPAMTVGSAITSIDVSAGVSGGTSPYTFSATGLPAGLTISGAGVISGTPTAAGAAGTATITVTDSAGTPTSESITIDYGAISAAPAATYTVTYANGGGTGTQTAGTATDGVAFTLPACTFTAPEGKEFKAWKIGDTEYDAGDTYTFTADTTVTAVWRVIAPVLPESTRFANRYTITISTPAISSNVSIYYTGDGSYPTTTTGTRYTGDIVIEETTTIKAVTVVNGSEFSDTVQATYTRNGGVIGGGGSGSSNVNRQVTNGGSMTPTNLTRLANQGKTLTVLGDNNATATFSTDALRKLGQASSTLISFSLKDVTAGHTADAPDAVSVYSLTAASNGNAITDFGGDVTVSLPAVGDKNPKRMVVFQMTDTGAKKLETTYNSALKTVSATVTGETLLGTVYEPFPYTDVAPGSWYYNAVDWADLEGITHGKAADSFDPTGQASRAETVTFLWRAAGCPQPTLAENPFTDVSADAWYYQPVLWAYERGITKGSTGGTFDPAGTVDRAQTTTFLYRLANGQFQGENVFTDVAEDAWYRDAVLWAYRYQVTTGTGEGAFSPNLLCDRAQTVTLLYRWFVR